MNLKTGPALSWLIGIRRGLSVAFENPYILSSHACGTARLRRVQRTKQPKHNVLEALPEAEAAETELAPPSKFASRRRPAQQIWLTATKRGRGLLFASGLPPVQQKQDTATKPVSEAD